MLNADTDLACRRARRCSRPSRSTRVGPVARLGASRVPEGARINGTLRSVSDTARVIRSSCVVHARHTMGAEHLGTSAPPAGFEPATRGLEVRRSFRTELQGQRVRVLAVVVAPSPMHAREHTVTPGDVEDGCASALASASPSSWSSSAPRQHHSTADDVIHTVLVARSRSTTGIAPSAATTPRSVHCGRVG